VQWASTIAIYNIRWLNLIYFWGIQFYTLLIWFLSFFTRSANVWRKANYFKKQYYNNKKVKNIFKTYLLLLNYIYSGRPPHILYRYNLCFINVSCGSFWCFKKKKKKKKKFSSIFADISIILIWIVLFIRETI